MFALLPFLFAIHTFQQQQYYKMYGGLTVASMPILSIGRLLYVWLHNVNRRFTFKVRIHSHSISIAKRTVPSIEYRQQSNIQTKAVKDFSFQQIYVVCHGVFIFYFFHFRHVHSQLVWMVLLTGWLADRINVLFVPSLLLLLLALSLWPETSHYAMYFSIVCEFLFFHSLFTIVSGFNVVE